MALYTPMSDVSDALFLMVLLSFRAVMTCITGPVRGRGGMAFRTDPIRAMVFDREGVVETRIVEIRRVMALRALSLVMTCRAVLFMAGLAIRCSRMVEMRWFPSSGVMAR
jgi:hypothetical protein